MKQAALLSLFWGLWYINFSARTILSPLLPAIEDELAIDHALAGGIFLFLSMGYTTALLLSGLLAPRIGYRRSILSGLLTMAFSLFALRYSASYASIVTVVFLIGLGAGIYLPCAIPLLTTIFGRQHWGKAIAFHDTAASFSILSIPLLTALGLKVLYWKDLFSLLGVVCLLGSSGLIFFSPDAPTQEEKRTRFFSILKRRSFWIMSTLWVFAAANGLGLYSVIPLFLVKGNGMSLDWANTVFGLSRMGGFFVAILAGFLADRFGANKILFLFLLTTGLSTAGLSIARPGTALIVNLVAQATVSTGFFPVALVAISKLTHFDDRSAFTGMAIAIGVIFGIGLTPSILGAIADFWNFRLGFLGLGVLTASSSFLLKYI